MAEGMTAPGRGTSPDVCPVHGEPWVVPDAPDGHRRCTFYIPELGASEDYGCPQSGRTPSREREHLPGCCVRSGAACDCDLIVAFTVEDAEKEANRG